MRVSFDEFAKDFAKGLMNDLQFYSDQIADGVKNAVDETAKELVQDIKVDAPVRTGEYKKHMEAKTTYESRYSKYRSWHVKDGYYRLTYLLERGHAKRGGGRTKAYPHIEKNEQKAIDTLDKKVKEVIKKRTKEIIKNASK